MMGFEQDSCRCGNTTAHFLLGQDGYTVMDRFSGFDTLEIYDYELYRKLVKRFSK